MLLAVRVQGLNAAIVGYAPDGRGAVKAIVVMDGMLHAVALDQLELLNLPKKLRKRSTNDASQHERVNVRG